MLDLEQYHYLYNADAHFKALDRFGAGFFDMILKSDLEGFNAICWGLAEMSLQGELMRRYQGLEAHDYLTESKVRNMISIKQIADAVKILIDTINDGMGVEEDKNDEIDEVLMELQKKTENNSPEHSTLAQP